MRSGWIPAGEMEHILAALTAPNRLACEVSLATGLRIGDVLALKSGVLKNQRFTVWEKKTGKTRRVYLPRELWERCLEQAGKVYVFGGRLNGKSHRTRQAVYKDLRRAADLFRVKAHISPHSARKAFAVELYNKTGDLKRVQRLLNHADEAVTVLYAMADQVEKRKGLTVKKR